MLYYFLCAKEKRCFLMDTLSVNPIGDIHITVYETANKKQFFYLKSDNENLLPVLDYLDTSLSNFKANNS